VTDPTHKSTIILAAETIAKLAELLELSPDKFMIVIPKTAWREFANRCSLDARGFVKTSPQIPTEHAPRWLQLHGVYYVPGQ